MGYPTFNGSTVGIKGQGVTTIRWGTDAFYANSGFYVVTRFSQKSLVENIKLPNGIGLTSTRVQLIDGSEFSITVRDDTRMTPPAVGGSVTITDAAGIVGTKTPGTVYAATVVDNNYEAAPKQAGERALVLERLTLIEGA